MDIKPLSEEEMIARIDASLAQAARGERQDIKPLSEEGLLAQIDESLAQAARGEVRDSEEFEAEFDAELERLYGI